MIWLVDGAAEEGRDYTLDKLLPFWLLTAEQDWAICSNQQRGVSSHAYTPGPLSTYKEYNLDRFLRWYIQEMKAYFNP
jgi:Rieske 2Fe-2S family protein